MDFAIEIEEYGPDFVVEAPSEKKGKKCYPKLYVSGMKESDNLPMGEVVEVIAKVKKCEVSVREDEDGKTYCCTYEVHGFKPNGKSDFGTELEKLIG